MEVLGWVLAAVVLAGNIAATLALSRSSGASRKQQWAQLGIIWLAPVFGAVLIGLFYSIGRRQAPPKPSMRNEQEYPGVNLYPPHGPSDT